MPWLGWVQSSKTGSIAPGSSRHCSLIPIFHSQTWVYVKMDTGGQLGYAYECICEQKLRAPWHVEQNCRDVISETWDGCVQELRSGQQLVM